MEYSLVWRAIHWCQRSTIVIEVSSPGNFSDFAEGNKLYISITWTIPTIGHDILCELSWNIWAEFRIAKTKLHPFFSFYLINKRFFYTTLFTKSFKIRLTITLKRTTSKTAIWKGRLKYFTREKNYTYQHISAISGYNAYFRENRNTHGLSLLYDNSGKEILVILCWNIEGGEKATIFILSLSAWLELKARNWKKKATNVTLSFSSI